MKKLFFILILLASSKLFSQSQIYETTELSQFQLGSFLTGKGCVNTVDPPQGIKNDFQLSKLPDFGVKFSYRFQGTSTKLFADISYLSVFMKYKLYNNPNINWTNEFHYLNFGFGFEFSNFLLSLNLGLPTSGKWGFAQNFSVDLEKEDMNTMLQLRVGAIIPIIKDIIGDLNFIILADYFLVGALSQDSNYNPRIASLSIGLNYMFNL